VKSKAIILVLFGLVTTLAACQPQAETPTETTSPAETTSPVETPAETTTPAETPAGTGTASPETPSPSPS
jgi:hypothetical protein